MRCAELLPTDGDTARGGFLAAGKPFPYRRLEEPMTVIILAYKLVGPGRSGRARATAPQARYETSTRFRPLRFAA